ncbi:cytochrome P450 2L1 isoform X1 [Procambarus clarkii]|uniref:cytochrome P450 2L1 isoform X1 n=2 Tax=Procambarus clarkii TaxID=6728 RepID=UPI0037448EED
MRNVAPRGRDGVRVRTTGKSLIMATVLVASGLTPCLTLSPRLLVCLRPTTFYDGAEDRRAYKRQENKPVDGRHVNLHSTALLLGDQRMLVVATALVGVVMVLLLLLIKMSTSPVTPGLPPGEWGWPVIGYVPPGDVPLAKHVNKLRGKHGDIFLMKLGCRLLVVLANFELIKTAFAKPELQGRPHLFTFKIFAYFQMAGMLSSEGPVWHHNRRFAIQQLKNLGMGKSLLEVTVQREARRLLSDLEHTLGQPTEITWNINVCIVNVLWELVAARRYDINDEKIRTLSKKAADNFDIIQGPLALLDLYPWLRSLLPEFLKNAWMKLNEVKQNRDKLDAFMHDIVMEHLENFDPRDPQDFIDAFLVDHVTSPHNPSDHRKYLLSEPDLRNLKSNLSDLYMAGTETTSSTLRWGFLYLAMYPQVQAKIQKEIDAVLPRDTFPALEHKDKLVYLEAALREIQRKATIVPMGVSHLATSDTIVAGYCIPKGTMVMAAMEGCHNDPQYWERPQDFYPEHFLDEQGELINKREGFLPFCLGRRQCFGEPIARLELYIIVAALLQKYTITLAPNEKVSTEGDPRRPLFNFARPFKVILTKRD